MRGKFEPEHITEILARMYKNGLKATINRVRSYLHRAFKVGCQAHLDPVLQSPEQSINFGLRHNPVSLVPRQTAFERALDRNLSENEIAFLWEKLPSVMADHTVRFFKLMFALGGQRPKETVSAPWSCYDFQERLLVLPKELTKNKREHIVPLNSLAMDLLLEQRVYTGHCGYPFPLMRGSGFLTDRHMRLDSLNTSIRRCISTNGMEPFTPRDIRRTCKTLMGKIGLSKDIRDRIHNHALNDVSSRHYDRYDYLKEKREALNQWDIFMRSITEPDSNIVVLAREAS
ncbi:site-specific integrase [Endozoicomonas acroporae]|uniref:site-specific integrase n=1 Tax=Endozoicomonas acroporae TaxID=1701104 RepID=UPI0013D71D76|nr:site-specific integrase [Endozoicomonas acroporae]